MKAELLQEFDDFKEKIVKSIYKYVEKSSSKTIRFFRENNYYTQGEGIDDIVYDKAFIKDGNLYVKYSIGEGYEQYNSEIFVEELSSFEIPQIYDMIKLIIK